MTDVTVVRTNTISHLDYTLDYTLHNFSNPRETGRLGFSKAEFKVTFTRPLQILYLEIWGGLSSDGYILLVFLVLLNN